MQVQPITDVNLKQTNTSFNARFIDDKNGYFRKLWQDALVNSDFNKVVDRFYYSNKNHVLEITNIEENGTKITVFNHRNGYEKICKVHDFVNLKLQELMDRLMLSNHLFTEGSMSAKIYQKLTGQKVDIEHQI